MRLLGFISSLTYVSALRMFSSSRLFSSAVAAPAAATAAGGSCSVLERKQAALTGLFIADAVASPVHWMYDLRQLKADYGTITGYVKPKAKFAGSILNLSNTGGGGRGSDQGSIIGDVINHGKKEYWGRGLNNHYHGTLDAGENTLEAQLVRVLLRTMSAKGAAFTLDDFRNDYITFMRTPGSHNDTYASTAHRQFFANLVKGAAPSECQDNDGHNTDAIDALTLVVPIILKFADLPRKELHQKVISTINVTRRTRALDRYAMALADLMVEVLKGKPLRAAIEQVGEAYFQGSVASMVSAERGDPMVACYIDSSFPALLHFAYKYSDSPEAAVLASANAGGENVARGSVLGALMGCAHGMSGWPAWSLSGLKERDAIQSEIGAFLSPDHSSL